MERLSKKILSKEYNYPVKVLQFGEGNFMRAFVDWQIQEMNKQHLFNGKVDVVQPIGRGLSTSFREQDNLYTVVLEGILNDEIVTTYEINQVIDQVINPYTDWQNYLKLAENDELEFIFSNTTEAGIQYVSTDSLDDAPQSSFPGKLTAFLYRRFCLGKKGFTIIPCELIDRNGEKLKEIILHYADDWKLPTDFIQWIENENVFCCSLVDRIVPGYPKDSIEELQEKLGYEDKLIVKAEPFMLWVIEGPEALKETLPLEKAGLNVIITDDMTPYRERKVHLLNGPHTAMVPLALLANIDTVEDVMNDADFKLFIDNLFTYELIPTLSLPEEELNIYAEQIKERFLNPFVKHQLTSIALNSVSKFDTRLLPCLIAYQEKEGLLPTYITTSLAAMILTYRGDNIQPQDDAEVIEIFKTAWQSPESVAQLVLEDDRLWGQDLSQIPELVSTVQDTINALEKNGARKVIQTINQGMMENE